MKGNEEFSLLYKFRGLYKSFPAGIIIKTESPDFIVEDGPKRIGIELTEAFQNIINGHSELQMKSSDQSSFVNMLIKKIQPYVPFTFSIGVNFNFFYLIKRNDREIISNAVLPYCIVALMNVTNKESITITDHHVLPKENNKIHLSRLDEIAESFNTQAEGGSVSNFIDEDLKAILLKKHDKLQKYQSCDEYWLLIKEGNYYAGTFDEIKLVQPIISNFSKIFILRTKKSELIQLK